MSVFDLEIIAKSDRSLVSPIARKLCGHSVRADHWKPNDALKQYDSKVCILITSCQLSA